ncbi:MAG: hypothetical protein IPL61_29255 [Myxococcales bacterium]|nr:hypothetical protein [Myxococcales bacterium]
MYLPRPRLVVLAAVIGGSLIACGPKVSGDDDDVPIDAATDGAVPIDGPGGIDADETPPSRVYAHSGDTLYRIDTTTNVANVVGMFTNLAMQGMLDIAVDRNERMIGVTRDKIFEIDPATAACTFLADFTGSALTSLSFVPADPANPDGAEMLVAATDTGAVIRIDVVGTAATATVIGDYGQLGGMDIISSGDIVYVKGFGTVATVDIGAATGMDYLATLDPTNNWAATVSATSTGFDKIFGVAFWGGTLYGFVDNGFGLGGSFIRIDRQTGVGTLIEASTIRWFGAGVTTEAPIIP